MQTDENFIQPPHDDAWQKCDISECNQTAKVGNYYCATHAEEYWLEEIAALCLRVRDGRVSDWEPFCGMRIRHAYMMKRWR